MTRSLCLILFAFSGVAVGTVDAQTVSLTNATLFRTDSTGTNLNNSGTVVLRGAWTSVVNQQNIPGNYGAQLFLSTVPNPGAGDFISPALSMTATLDPGVHTFYFWADSDDTQGGSAAFGLNLFLNGAGSLSPSISAYVAPGAGQTVNPDSSTICTAGFDFRCAHGAGTLSVVFSPSTTVTLSDFKILGVGGASASPSCVDLVGSAPILPPPHADGICDTYGQFTLTVSATYYFAQFAIGGGWQTTLTYINYSLQPVTCVTTFFFDSGAPQSNPFGGSTSSSRMDMLQPGQTIHAQSQADLNAPVTQGWAKATCNGPLKASVLYRLYQQGAPIGEAGVNGMTAAATKFVTFGETKTGVAYANPSSSQSAVVTFTIISSGVKLGSTSLTLAPGAHGAAYLGPLLGVSSFTGFVEITSSIPIISLSLNNEAFPAFSSLPPGELSDSTSLVFQ